MAGVMNIIVVVVLVGFGVWVTKEVGALRISVAEIKAWQVNHLATIETEKKTLKLEIESEMEKLMRNLLEKYDGKVDVLSSALRVTDQTVRDTGARVQLTGEQVTSLSAQISRTTALLQQVLVDMDFRRNEPKEEKGK